VYTKLHINLLLTGWACLLLCAGCSPLVNTRGSRAYHEFTTRYNVYHNAEKAYHEILDEQLNKYRDDHARLLTLYPSPRSISESGGTHALAQGGPFDGVIRKTEKAIREHSITAKPRRDPSIRLSPEYRRWLQQNEFNPFIHNAWLLMGKAHLQNGHPENALTVFNEVIRIFGPESDASREARVWMVRAYTELGRLHEAEQAIHALKFTTLPSHLKKVFLEVQVQYLMEKGEYAAAIPYLREAINKEKRIKQVKRWQFLLGQLHTLVDETEAARQTFARLKKLDTPKDMLQQAMVYQAALTSDSDSLFHTLKSSLVETGALAHTTISAGQFTSDTVNLRPLPQSYATLFQPDASASTPYRDGHWDFFRSRWERGAITLPKSDSGDLPISATVQFSNDRDTVHLLLLIPEQDDYDREQFLYAMADYTFSRYQLRSFDFTSVPLPHGEALAIHPFQTYDDAIRYARDMEQESPLQMNQPGKVQAIPISESNLRLLQQGTSMEEYLLLVESRLISPGKGSPTEEKSVPLKDETSIAPGKTSRNSEPERAERTDSTPEAEKLAVEPKVMGGVAPKTVEEVAPGAVKENTQEAVEYAFPSETNTRYAPVAPEELKLRLQQKETEALSQHGSSANQKSRARLLKEKERERKKRLQQQQEELKKRQKEREKQLKQREKERKRAIKSR
jgi:tetratricopeptide (TPR) repeat protein